MDERPTTQGAGAGLSSYSLRPSTCDALDLVAYPRSLAALKHIYWRSACWLSELPTSEIIDQKIFAYLNKNYNENDNGNDNGNDNDNNDDVKNPAIWQFGSNSNYDESAEPPKIKTYVVFPRLNFSDLWRERVQEKWTDMIVVPAIDRALQRDGNSSTDSAFAKIKQCSQDGLDISDRPDTTVHLQQNHLKELWTDMQRIVDSGNFNEFADMFLVIGAEIRQEWTPGPAAHPAGRHLQDFWADFSKMWDDYVDMDYIPIEAVDVHMNCDFQLHKPIAGEA